MTAVVHFVADERDPWGLVARYLAAVAPGSYLALSHGTYENLPPRSVQAGLDTYANATEHAYLRSRAEVERFFDGLELVAPYEGAGPGLTYVGLWGAEDPEAADSDGSRGTLLWGRPAPRAVRCPSLRSGGEMTETRAKPTVAALGIDVGALDWQRSGTTTARSRSPSSEPRPARSGC